MYKIYICVCVCVCVCGCGCVGGWVGGWVDGWVYLEHDTIHYIRTMPLPLIRHVPSMLLESTCRHLQLGKFISLSLLTKLNSAIICRFSCFSIFEIISFFLASMAVFPNSLQNIQFNCTPVHLPPAASSLTSSGNVKNVHGQPEATHRKRGTPLVSVSPVGRQVSLSDRK